jgi:hypothetical protein
MKLIHFRTDSLSTNSTDAVIVHEYFYLCVMSYHSLRISSETSPIPQLLLLLLLAPGAGARVDCYKLLNIPDNNKSPYSLQV